MKHVRKPLSLLLAFCMVFSIIATVSAEETTLDTSDDPISEESISEFVSGAAPSSDDGVATTSLTMGTKPENGTTTGNPFEKGTGGSNSFRIPAMVTLNDGTIVAAADARWNTTFDGGGLDTVVSYSKDNGANWNYTFANYLGDNGNEYNGSSSTAFIDPALATDGETVYMLCDLYPYGVALNGSNNTAPSTAVGFNDDGTLKLAASGSSTYNYYLKDGQIYDSSNNVVSGYTVDAYFNITGNGYDTNLFFYDSPYQVVRTGYLYLTKSTDGGKTWFAPTLIPNVKTSSEQVCLVGPGRGLVTSSGMIVFPVYSFHGDNEASSNSQRLSFIYSTDSGATWNRTAELDYNWASEAAVVELNDGTLRFFFRNGTKHLCYVDYANNAWGTPVEETSISTNSNTQLSAISYSKTVDGKQVILVSCPTGSGSSGSNSSSASERLNGKIFVGLVNKDNNKSMDWITGTSVSLTSQHSSTNYFMYSCLTELSDGSVAILYEDNESAWGTGNDYYYQMTYSTIAASSFGLTFDAEKYTEVFVDEAENTGVTVTVSSDSADTYENWYMTVTPNQTVEVLTTDYAAYQISLCNADNANRTVSSATIELPVGDLDTTHGLYAFVVNADGSVTTVNGELSDDGLTYTFTADLPAVVGLAENDATAANTKYITLTVGESQTVTDDTGNYENATGNENPNSSIAEMTVKGSTAKELKEVTELVDGKQYLIYSIRAGALLTNESIQETNWSGGAIYGLNMTGTPSVDSTMLWTFNGSTSGSTATGSLMADSKYLTFGNTSASTTDTATTLTLAYDSTNARWTIYYNGYYLSDWGGTNRSGAYGYNDANDTGNYWKIYEIVGGDATTEITFKGVAVGNTTAKVGDTWYNITVEKAQKTVYVTVGSTTTYVDASTSEPVVENSTVATATLSEGTLTITGVAEGTTTVTTDTTVYTVNVTTATILEIPQGSSTEIYVTLANDQYVKWSTANSSYVGVAGVYDATNLAYTNEATLFGQQVTSAGIEVTGTVYNSDGTVASASKWLVTVTEAAEGTTSVTRYYDVDQVENCVLYYSINGGELVQVNGSGVSIIPEAGVDNSYTVIDGTWYGDMSLMFFAAPNEGYALTHLFVEDSANQYYVLSDGVGSDGNEDVTKSSAWPFLDEVDPEEVYKANNHTYSIEEIASLYKAKNYDAYEAIKGDSTVWKTLKNSLHGFRWALLEGYVTPARLQELYENARALGCTGVTTVTKSFTNSENPGTAADPISICAVAQKLATLDKKVTRITNATGEDVTEAGIVKIGYTITYRVTVTVPATPAVAKYWDVTNGVTSIKTATDTSGNEITSAISYTDMVVTDSLSDFATGFSWTNATATSSTTEGGDTTYPVEYTITLTKDNFGSVVTGGTITNTATLDYNYTASYGTGSHKSSVDKVLDIAVDIPVYVVDFGLPVEITLSDKTDGTGSIIECKDGLYGTATLNTAKNGFTYTPTSVIQDVDYVEFTYQLQNDSTTYNYKVAIYPATTVYYEEGFATYTGSWRDTGSKGTGTQTTQVAGNSSDEYGYDAKYAAESAGPSNNTNAVSTTIGDDAVFTFTGTGLDIYANCTTETGAVSILIRNSKNAIVKLLQVKTATGNGGTSATTDQAANSYSLPIASITGLDHDTYTVTIRHSKVNADDTGNPVKLDGFRVYGTLKEEPAFYTTDLEDNPTFIELRDQVLKSLNVTLTSNSEDYTDYASKILSQVYSETGATAGVVIVTPSSTGYTDAQLTDLLDNGPKNELFLQPNQSLVFTITTDREVQIGLKAPIDAVACTINGSSKSITSSTDMFYTVLNKGSSGEQTITITNTGNNILSVTKLKICDDPNASLGTLTEEDMAAALESIFGVEEEAPAEPPKPGKGNSDQKPGKGNSGQKPGKGNSGQKPGKGNSGQKPGKGNSVQNPKNGNIATKR